MTALFLAIGIAVAGWHVDADGAFVLELVDPTPIATASWGADGCWAPCWVWASGACAAQGDTFYLFDAAVRPQSGQCVAHCRDSADPQGRRQITGKCEEPDPKRFLASIARHD